MKILLLLLVVFTLKTQALSTNLIERLMENGNKIITAYKEFNLEDYDSYLEGLLKMDNIPTTQTLDFPSTLHTNNYTLTEGTVSRFYDPIQNYGTYDRPRINYINNEFFGVTQVYGPKIDFGFRYTTTREGAQRKGSFSVVVSHKPVELQVDLGEKAGDACVVNTKENTVFYFYDNKLTMIPKAGEASEKEVVNDLVQQLGASWLSKLYRIIMQVKFENIVAETKNKILNDEQYRQYLKGICKTIN